MLICKVMANFLINISGKKDIVLYSPANISSLSFPPGSSTSSLTFDETLNDTHSPTGQLHRKSCTMEPGDILYIPPFWPHAVHPRTPSVAVNVFFRNMAAHLYDAARKDLYGNVDLAAYTQGRTMINKVLKSFDEVPAQARGFYIKRLADELLASIS